MLKKIFFYLFLVFCLVYLLQKFIEIYFNKADLQQVKPHARYALPEGRCIQTLQKFF